MKDWLIACVGNGMVFGGFSILVCVMFQHQVRVLHVCMYMHRNKLDYTLAVGDMSGAG